MTTQKFNFRLEPVLKHRQVLEDQAVTALAHAHRELIASRENLLKTTALLEATYRETASGSFDLAENLNLSFYRESLADARRCQEEEVSKAGVKVETCRSFAVEKRRDKLALEKLREKKYAAYRREANQAEQKEYDEQGTMRAALQSRFWPGIGRQPGALSRELPARMFFPAINNESEV